MTDLLELPKFAKKESSVPDGPVLSFAVKRDYLSRALNRVSSVVSGKDMYPILKNLHFQISGTDLRISASDSVLSAVAHIPVDSSVDGAAVIPANRLLTLVREADGDILYFAVAASKGKYGLNVKGGKAKWSFALSSPVGFPDFSAADQTKTTPINREDFLNALLRVRKAAAEDPMRPYLMLIDLSKGRMRASDSIRFQEVKYAFPFDCQIPLRAVSELISRLRSCDLEEVGVGQTENALLFRFGVVLLVAQKSNAKFPNVDEVLLTPNFSNDQELIVDRKELVAAVRRACITVDESTSAVVLSLNAGSLSVECKDKKGGFAVETVEADWSHSPRHVSFNYRHLLDLLASLDTEKCAFRLGKDLKAKPSAMVWEDKEAGFTAVLSQIRLDWY